ncbi:uncharacterized protein [Pleurodeles waltl]
MEFSGNMEFDCKVEFTGEVDLGEEVELGTDIESASEVVFQEVGAEIELQENDGCPEETCVVLENKEGCPSWDLMHSSDSSCDESVETHVVEPAVVLNDAEILKREEVMNPHLGALPQRKKLDVGQQVAKFSISKGLRKRLCTYGVVLGGKPDLWNNAYKAALMALQKKGKGNRGRGRGSAGSHLATGPRASRGRRPRQQDRGTTAFRTTRGIGMECLEDSVLQDSENNSREQENSYNEWLSSNPGYPLSHEQVGQHKEMENISSTQPLISDDPSLERHMCQKCGQSFRRMCNLEKHVCLRVAWKKASLRGGRGRPRKAFNMGPAITSTSGDKRASETGEKRSSGTARKRGAFTGVRSKLTQAPELENSCPSSTNTPLGESIESSVPDTVDMITLDKMCIRAQNELRQLQKHLQVRGMDPPPLAKGLNFTMPVQVGRRVQNPLQTAKVKDSHQPSQGKKKVLVVEVLAPEDAEVGSSPSGSVQVSPTNRSNLKDKNVYSVVSHLNGYVRPWSTTPATFMCDHCGRQFMRKCNLDKHVCWDMDPKFSGLKGVLRRVAPETPPDQSMGQTPSPPSIQVDNSGEADAVGPSDRGHLVQKIQQNKITAPLDKSKSGENQSLATAQVRSAVKSKFKCQQCFRTFLRNCDFATHLRWHAKEAELLQLTNQIRKLQETIGEPPPGPKPSVDWQTLQGNPSRVSTSGSTSTSPWLGQSGAITEHKRFSCDECGREFVHKCNLARHLHMHMETNFLITKEDDEGESSDLSLGVSSLSGTEMAGLLSPDSDFGSADIATYQQTCFQEEMEPMQEEGQDEEDETTANSQSDFEVVVKTEEDYDFFEDNPYRHAQAQEKDEGFMVVKVPREDGQGSKTVMMDMKDYEKFHTPQTNPSNDWSFSEDTDSLDMNIKMEHPGSVRVLSYHTNPWYRLIQKSATDITWRLKTKRRFGCRDCGALYGLASQLKRHRSRKKRQYRIHRCDCRKVFRGQLHFLRHQLQHLEATVFICATCGRSLMGHQQLLSHGWVHPNVSRFQCSCGVEFRRLPSYLWHTLPSIQRRR